MICIIVLMVVIRQHQLQDETSWELAQRGVEEKSLRLSDCDTHSYTYSFLYFGEEMRWI